jgi:ABC-type Mn2+/Zn2+ transport system permease subunit
VFALLLIPAATAYQLTSSLHRMMQYSVGIGILVSVIGVLLSFQFDLPSGPAIVLLATGVFFLAVAFSPKRAPKPAMP